MLNGLKKVETVRYKLPVGLVALHVGTGAPSALVQAKLTDLCSDLISRAGEAEAGGVIIGCVRVEGAVDSAAASEVEPWALPEFGRFTNLLSETFEFPHPIPCAGKLGSTDFFRRETFSPSSHVVSAG